ncbi:glycosyltransferase family 2 protein [Bacillus sp. AK128]
MNKSIAVVICNWNKKEDVLNCIESVLSSSFKDLDIIVVDNASSDESVEAIRRTYPTQVKLLVNNVNLGGSGGFNTGIKWALANNYKYTHLLDNDVILDKDALYNSFMFMEEHPTVGAVGSKLYSYYEPEYLQELGAEIDWERFYIHPFYKGEKDNIGISEIVECDYVPACSVLVRTAAIKDVGLLDESCFIYWDDIEWFYRFKQSAYKVIALSSSKVWHKMGAGVKANTFSTYYFWRNRINFFISNLEIEKLDLFAERLSEEMYQAIYMCNYNKQYNVAKTILLAVEDALLGVRGEAIYGRIFEREKVEDRFTNFMRNQSSVILVTNCAPHILRAVVEKILINFNTSIYLEDKQYTEYILDKQCHNIDLHRNDMDNTPVIKVCQHVLEVEFSNDINVYVDQYFNIILNEEDVQYVKSYKNIYNFNKNVFLPVLKQRFMEHKQSSIERNQV